MHKKGVSGVVTAVLLILLAIGAMGILWTVIQSFVQTGSDNINFNLVTLEITSADLGASGLEVKVKRDNNEGDLQRIKIILSDSSGNSQSFEFNSTIDALETQTVSIALQDISFLLTDLMVSASPIVLNENKELQGLSTKEKQVTFNNITDITNGLVAYYSFDNGNATDVSGNGNDGTHIGGLDCTGNPGIINNGCTFVNGSGGYVDLAVPSGMDEFKGTIMAWAYPTAIGTNKYVYSGGGTESDSRYYLQWSSGNFVATRWGTSIPLATPTLNSWYHLALTWNSSKSVSGYFDGLLVQELIDNSVNDSGLATQRIGSQASPGLEFDGNIDEVRIYDRALSASEINYIFSFGDLF